MEHKAIGRKLIRHFDKMVFDEPSHTYTVVGKGLKPVSTFISEFYKPFNAEKQAGFSAFKEGITKEEMLKKWDDIREEACTNGTMVHDFGERYVIDRYGVESDLRYSSVNQHLKRGEELQPKSKALVKFWDNKPEWYVPIALELRMFCVALGIAGTADIILLDTRDNTLVIADYKTNKDLFKNFKDKRLLGIFKDLKDMPYSKYVIQLSMYQILLEKAGYKVSRRFLVYLKADGEYTLYDTPNVTEKLEGHFNKQKEYASW
jgi:hypothetical protein